MTITQHAPNGQPATPPAPSATQPNIRHQFEYLTLFDAQLLLAENTGNRNLMRSYVNRLARLMLEGGWHGEKCPQPVMITRGGQLIDGQHRLQAILEAGKTNPGIRVPMWVAWDVPDDTFRYVDHGRARTAAQTLTIAGQANASAKAASARQVLRYERFPHLVWSGGGPDVTPTEVEDFVMINDDEADMLDFQLKEVCKVTPLLYSSLLALNWLVLRHSQHVNSWSDFAEGLLTGAGLSKGDPRLTMLRDITGTRWGSGQGTLGSYIKGWNACLTGQPRARLHFRQAEVQRVGMPKVR